MNDFWANMIEAAKAENARGIAMRAGKRYTSAAVRLEIARRHLGDTIGVETEIFHYGTEKGSPVVVRATIRNPDGRIIAQGTAEEIRGAGNVNQTSALENAETSALGRALAMLGLSGGEFASANEMDGVERKAAAQSQAPRRDNGPERRDNEPPHDPETGEVLDERNPPAATPEEEPDAFSTEFHAGYLRDFMDNVKDGMPASADRRMIAEAYVKKAVDKVSSYKPSKTGSKWVEIFATNHAPAIAKLDDDLAHTLNNAIATARDRTGNPKHDPRDFQPLGGNLEPVILGELRIA
jgi:hypothetical protein